ncbi:glycosyltransferase [Candidatus Levibacter sp. Uisw_134_01]|uniref:CgeB family protein n=1 Tax=Candidatus Levibacter sp. Uisw_134_01 TaxID=3230999 RepID=UPI003D3CA7CD
MLRNAIDQLKKKKTARKINTTIKGFALDIEFLINRFRYGDFWNKYSSHDSKQIAGKLLQGRLKDKKNKTRAPRLNIFFFGTYYDHEMQGFYQGLEGIGNVQTYINISGNYGINVPKGLKLSIDEYRKWQNHIITSIYKANKHKKIDFIIGTFTAPSVSLETLLSIRSLGVPIVNMAMDDMLPQHWRTEGGLKKGAFALGPAVDLNLHTTPSIIPRYIKAGYPAIYFPFASDEKIFYPQAKKVIDVLFVGNCYGKREELISKCLKAGIRVEAYGKFFPKGHIPGDKVPYLFGRSKIIIGSGLVGHSGKLTTLKLRDFDAPMSGALYLTSHNSQLENHFIIGKEILTYSNIDDCINKINYFLRNDEKRLQIAMNGRARSCAEHKWSHRMHLLRQTLGL